MATRKPASKPAPRKAQAKKANAPMKNAPAAKAPKAETKAAASRAARTMAKTVTPGMRKSAAKRVETTEARAAAKAVAKPEFQATVELRKVIATLEQDCATAEKGRCDEKAFEAFARGVSRAIAMAKKKHDI